MNTVEKTKKRTMQYWFRDGLPEIGMGFVFVVLSIYFYLQFKLSQSGLIRVILDISLILIILGSIWIVNTGIKYFKEKLTYPRSGYAVYNQTRRFPRWVNGLMGGIAGAFFAAFIVSNDLTKWLSAITGTVICFALFFIGIKVNLLRFYILSLLSFGFGLSISLLNPDSQLGSCLVYGFTGVAIIISGTITLISYIHHTQKPETLSHE